MIVTDRTDLSLRRPRDAEVTKQLIAVGLSNFAEGMSTSVANFLFNALLLVFGPEVSAAYHIARRIYQQLAGPLYRSYSVAASIIVGQRIGEGKPVDARFSGLAITALNTLTLGVVGAVIWAGTEPLSTIFTKDSETLGYAVAFTRISGISMLFLGILPDGWKSLRRERYADAVLRSVHRNFRLRAWIQLPRQYLVRVWPLGSLHGNRPHVRLVGTRRVHRLSVG